MSLPSADRCSFVESEELLAYCAGLMDGDGYFKITKSYRWPSSTYPYYGTSIGVQQLWPGDAVRLLAARFGGEVRKQTTDPRLRPIARWELHVRRAEAATKRLLPYLLVKKDHALVMLEVGRLRRSTRGSWALRTDRLERLRRTLLSLHEGSWASAGKPLPVSKSMTGYERLGPAELGWTRKQVLAYLGGIMDSDGNFRVEKRQIPGMLGPQYRISLRCGQVAPSPAVNLLRETFGGYTGIKKSRSPKHRDLIVWSLYDKSAIPAIRALLPFVVVKSAEAHLLLELRLLKAEGKKGLTEWVHANRWHESVKMRKRCYTTEQIAEFERIHRTVQALHSGLPSVSR